MIVNDSLITNSEKIIFALRELYHNAGYRSYKMSKFEEYDFYAGNKDFLVSDNVITFTDTNGKLMAMKPDVTLSIIKNGTDDPNSVQKVYYVENVYRVSKGTNSFKEIMQTGLECLGNVNRKEIAEVLSLAAKSMCILSSNAVLEISDLDVLDSLIADENMSNRDRSDFFKAISEKNIQEVDRLIASSSECVKEAIHKILKIHGSIPEAISQLRSLNICNEVLDRFLKTLELLKETEYADVMIVDFSVVDDIQYYNGIVFKGFVHTVPTAVLSGGEYDRLMRRMHRSSKAIGFAVYTDMLEWMDLNEEKASETIDGYINVALPKGRLGEKVYAMFADAGFECPSILEPSRKLIFENPEKKVRYFWVKPSDVAIYVERGAADVGVCGKDILLEYEPDVYELLDMQTGKCRMCVAAPKSFVDDNNKTLRVATKFSNIAKTYYQSKGRDIDMIHLNGSIELAPILGLSDVIVDIVETGTTLKENNLDVFETIVPISARFIANKSSYKFKSSQIDAILAYLTKTVGEKS